MGDSNWPSTILQLRQHAGNKSAFSEQSDQDTALLQTSTSNNVHANYSIGAGLKLGPLKIAPLASMNAPEDTFGNGEDITGTLTVHSEYLDNC
jgi:hypothetical protein